MTTRSRLLCLLSAVTLCLGLSLAPAAFAQDDMSSNPSMSKGDTMSKPAGKKAAKKAKTSKKKTTGKSTATPDTGDTSEGK